MYFGPAFLGVLVTSFWWYRRYARMHGLLFPVWPWVAIIGVSTLIGANLSHDGLTSGRQWVSDIGPPLVLAAAIGVVAAWLRSWQLAATAAAMATATGVVASVAHGNRPSRCSWSPSPRCCGTAPSSLSGEVDK